MGTLGKSRRGLPGAFRRGERLSPAGVTVEALPSTDEGVAFLVTAEGRTVFHAGDLNWWHWEGEDPVWNRNMEADFPAVCGTSPGPEDRSGHAASGSPSGGGQGFRGPRYFLELGGYPPLSAHAPVGKF